MTSKDNKRITLLVFIIVLLSIPAFVYYERYQALSYFTKAEELRSKGELEKALSYYEKAYDVSPLNRDVVHGYVGGLIYFERYVDAYKIVTDYFSRTNKDLYIDDADLWVDKAMTELQTNHCMDASVSAWHVLARTLEADGNNEIAGAILRKAKECLDSTS